MQIYRVESVEFYSIMKSIFSLTRQLLEKCIGSLKRNILHLVM